MVGLRLTVSDSVEGSAPNISKGLKGMLFAVSESFVFMLLKAIVNLPLALLMAGVLGAFCCLRFCWSACWGCNCV